MTVCNLFFISLDMISNNFIQIVMSAALTLMGEFSYKNNWAKKAVGLYMYSTGSQRQPLSVMAHLGISESYDAITSKKREHKISKNLLSASISAGTKSSSILSKGGSLSQLSDSMVDMARKIASTGLFATSYNNINMVFKSAEQIVGRTGMILSTE